MQKINMKKNKIVQLREKKLSSGKKSLYLDIYHNGEREYEFLKIYIKSNPQNRIERQNNKDMLSLAEDIRSKREMELKHSEYG